jgi:hypothetical protein
MALFSSLCHGMRSFCNSNLEVRLYFLEFIYSKDKFTNYIFMI